MAPRPVMLVILDGWGERAEIADNAVKQAKTPNFDRLWQSGAHNFLRTSGFDVGLPSGQMGNSEVGHLNIGAGRVVMQDLPRIGRAIEDGSLAKAPALTGLIAALKKSGGVCQLVGLVSDGGVHSHQDHAVALARIVTAEGVPVVVHALTDGRDTAPQAGAAFVRRLEAALPKGAKIGTVIGRYYAMDRDNRWERTEKAWRCLVEGRGEQAGSAREAIEQSWAAGRDDEFILPTRIAGGALIQDGDCVLHFNFRKDRPRQMLRPFFQPDFTHFDRGGFQGAEVTCMMRYDQGFDLPFAFHHEAPGITLGQILSEAGLRQFHCAETEKYPHVTFYFNGGRSEPWPGEEQVLIPSPKVATYDLQPEMSAPEVADTVVAALGRREYPFIVVNFANGDMVGHTAVREAVIAAVEALDLHAGQVLDAAVAAGYAVILTADHGNCDELVDPVTQTPHTQHSLYPVPCLVIDAAPWNLGIGAGLDCIAPTVLQLMGLPRPAAMHGHSLLLSPARN